MGPLDLPRLLIPRLVPARVAAAAAGARLAAGEAVVCVTVERTEGSAPREAGAWLLVAEADAWGTIGGGRLEWDAIEQARAMLRADGVEPRVRRFALGPSLGQCCGGVVHLRFDRLGAADASGLSDRLSAIEIPRMPLAVFGGGHVGHALVRIAAMLPFETRWIDSRDGVFPADAATLAQCEHSDPVEAEVDRLTPGTRVVVMSFSHAEDLDIVRACLARQSERSDLRFVGLIGSATKWATFRRRLAERGFDAAEIDRVTCPIGIESVGGKEPGTIAVAIAAQLLQTR